MNFRRRLSTMSPRHVAVFLLLATLASVVMFSATVSRSESNMRVVTYIMRKATDSTEIDGGAEDSFQTGTNYNTLWIPILGARQVQILLRDSLTTAGGPYVDSVGAFQVHLSYDKTNYVAYTMSSFTFTDNDSLNFAYQGKFLGLNLSGGQTGVQFPGYLQGIIMPDHTTTEDNMDTLPFNWMRLTFQPTLRKRQTTSTENASAIGIRLLSRVFYSNITDSYVPANED